MKQEKKDQHIKTRVTKELKEKIDNYCCEHELSISAFLRVAIKSFFDKKEEDEI